MSDDKKVVPIRESLAISNERLETLRFRPTPMVVGYFAFRRGHIKYAMYAKPRWLTRFMFRVFFELDWEDVEENSF